MFAKNHSLRVGLSFGLTSGVITTLGLMVGLASGTNSKLAVIGGILTLAIADSFSDAMGIHFSEEAEYQHVRKEIWISTIATFFSKFFFTAIFVLPILIFDLISAIWVNLVLGFLILVAICWKIAQREKKSPLRVIFSHLLVTIFVIVIIDCLGRFIREIFK